MSRSCLSMRIDQLLDAPKRKPCRGLLRSKTRRRLVMESLEDRTLLATVTVDLVNFSFSPNPVTIHVGDTVHWVWDSNNHSTTSVAGSAEQWDSGVHNSGFTFDHTFTQTGSFSYYCVIHGFDNGDGTAGGMSGTITVQGASTLQSIAVTPANPSVPKGETEQFTATGTFSDGSTQDLTSQVTWASATTSVATISNASGSQGLATAVATGTSSISAALDGVTGSTVLTVSAAVLQSIAVTPANPSVPKGLTEQFTATGTFSDSSTQDLTSQVTWASATSSVATITTAGLATAVSTGSSTISAALGGISGSTVLTVAAPVLDSIAVTPANPSVPKGETEQFKATGTFSDNSTQDLTSQVTWASATTSVATITAAGLATGIATGTSTISAKLGGVTGSTVLTVSAAVLQSIAVTPANPSIAKGLTEQFTATGTFSDNSTQDLTSQVTWASATASVATITAAGLATAVATGTSSISATLGSVSGSTVLTVGTAVLQSIAVTPGSPSIAVGKTEQFTATGIYSDNSTQDLTSQVTWASATTSVATITAAGLATAVATGTSDVSAKLGGVTGSTVLTVSAAVLQSIAVTPANPGIAKGLTEQFKATGTYSDNSTKDLTSQVTWASATTSVATVTAAGLATGLATGTSNISATLNAITGSTVLTVSAAVLQSIAVTPANPSIAEGTTEDFKATGTYSDSSTQDLTGQVTWASSNTAVSSVSNTSGSQGNASGLAPGTSTISAMIGGIAGSTVLTVTAAALVSISVTPANPSIPVGEVQPFKATGTYSDSSTQDLTGQVTWASATTSVATIDSSGIASGIAVGTSAISAGLDGVTGTTVLTVTPVVLEMIMISPASPTVASGQTEQFMAMGMYSDDSTVDLTDQVAWASSSTSVATISNDPGTQGLATAVADGTTTISASFDGMTGQTKLTVATADLNPAAVRDNGQAGYYQYGVWTIAAGGLGGTHLSADPSASSSATARWLLNVPAGTYDVWATWSGGASNASNATYSIYDGFSKLGSAVEDQRATPGDGNYGGMSWAMLGTFTATQGRITVALSASGANGDVVADGVLLVPSMDMGASTMAMAEATGGSETSLAAEAGAVASIGQVPLPTAAPKAAISPGSTSIHAADRAATAPTVKPATVNYVPKVSAGITPQQSAAGKKVVLSKHASRKPVQRHQHIHESIIGRIARERVSSMEANGNHHPKA
jgi:plastocyanin